MEEFDKTNPGQSGEGAARRGRTFEDTVRSAAGSVTDTLDRAVDGAADLLGGDGGKKIAGGAAIGALAAIVLPVSLVGGALLGAGYAAYRELNKR